MLYITRVNDVGGFVRELSSYISGCYFFVADVPHDVSGTRIARHIIHSVAQSGQNVQP